MERQHFFSKMKKMIINHNEVSVVVSLFILTLPATWSNVEQTSI